MGGLETVMWPKGSWPRLAPDPMGSCFTRTKLTLADQVTGAKEPCEQPSQVLSLHFSPSTSCAWTSLKDLKVRVLLLSLVFLLGMSETKSATKRFL